MNGEHSLTNPAEKVEPVWSCGDDFTFVRDLWTNFLMALLYLHLIPLQPTWLVGKAEKIWLKCCFETFFFVEVPKNEEVRPGRFSLWLVHAVDIFLSTVLGNKLHFDLLGEVSCQYLQKCSV